MAKKKQPEMIYQIKVTLKRIKPPIWRKIQVPDDISLYKLHKILQKVMGWFDVHLHQFTVRGEYYGLPDLEFDFDFEVKNEKRVKLNQIVSGVGDKFTYEYDFGDGWEHTILLEKILPPEKGVHYPICIKGKRACPPEDCGGVWGYYELLEAIQNPDHPRHQEMRDWLGRDFDPEEFDIEAVNKALRHI